MKKLLTVAALLGSGVVSAAVVAVDFEQGVTDDNAVNFVPEFTAFDGEYYTYTEDGIAVSYKSGGVSGRYLGGNLEDYGSAFLQWCPRSFCSNIVTTIASISGDAFDLYSLDAIAFAGPGGEGIVVTGHLSAGGIVQQSVIVSDTGWANTVFGSDWSGLEYVTIISGDDNIAPGIDNIVISVVPIPAAVWLFGSGLGLLGWFRRRQTA
jgi:hypothetical protein